MQYFNLTCTCNAVLNNILVNISTSIIQKVLTSFECILPYLNLLHRILPIFTFKTMQKIKKVQIPFGIGDVLYLNAEERSEVRKRYLCLP